MLNPIRRTHCRGVTREGLLQIGVFNSTVALTPKDCPEAEEMMAHEPRGEDSGRLHAATLIIPGKFKPFAIESDL